MKSNFELFADTCKLLKGKWLWRILAVSMCLSMIVQVVGSGLHLAFKVFGIKTINDLWLESAELSARTGKFTLPPIGAYREVVASYGFEMFISFIFGAIVAWGVANAALKATRDNHQKWFLGAFDGFRNPFGFAWLQLVLTLYIFLWFLPLVVAVSVMFAVGNLSPIVIAIVCLSLTALGMVALYRYRLVWYLKNDYPELTATQCMAESARRMVGYKWKCFCFGLIYLAVLVAFLLVIAMAIALVSLTGSAVLISLMTVPLVFGTIFFIIIWFVHLIVAHAVFYRNLPQQAGASAI